MTIVGDLTTKALLAAMPGTRAELAARTGRDHSVVCKWVKRLYAERKIHISTYRVGKHGGAPQPVYARRKGADASPPVASVAARSKRQRDKAKAPPIATLTRWAPWHPWHSVLNDRATVSSSSSRSA